MHKRSCDATRMKKYLFTSTCLILLTALLSPVTILHFQGAKALSAEDVITNDTVWAFKNSPFEVVGDVIIASGAKLTIEPGVKVSFETGSSLIVSGSLYAVGTSFNRISFTSNRNEPVAGDWSGMKFYGDENSTLTMSFCDVEYARDGITIASLGRALIGNSTINDNSLSGIHTVGVTNLLIQNNTIKLNANGISASGVTTSGLKIIGNNILNNENGVYLYVDGDDSRIHDVTISDNTLKDNINGVYLHSNARVNAHISNVKISDNMVRSIEYGIYFLAEAYGEPGLLKGPCIYNSIISRNTISFSEYAIYLDSRSSWWSWISGLTISRNIIHSSENGIFMHAFRSPQPPYQGIPFDIILVSNTISANRKGAEIFGDITANFTGNSVSYNSYGIHLDSSAPSENVARNNDIYQNTAYGVYVVKKASIKAGYNYWGAQNGPYHETLNPSGEGDRVNGAEENLVLTPFLTEPFGEINDVPFAVLKADKTTVPVNQTILFDGFESTDDSSIVKYFFDFGDGSAIPTFPGIAKHMYASPGVYNVSLVVMDDLGVKSTNTAIETITVFLPSLVASVVLNPASVLAQGNVTVEIHVSDGETGVPEAFVQLSSDHGGNFEPSSGYTDSTGDFESTFSAPNVSEPLSIRITVTASKENYKEDSHEVYLSVLTSSPGGKGLDFSWIWFVAVLAVIVVIVVIAVAFIKKKRQKMTAITV